MFFEIVSVGRQNYSEIRVCFVNYCRTNKCVKYNAFLSTQMVRAHRVRAHGVCKCV